MSKQQVFSLNLLALASLLNSLVFQVDAASLIPKAITGDSTIISGGFEIQTAATPSRISPIGTTPQTSIAPFTPTDENLIFNTTVHQGESASLGWIFYFTLDGSTVFDGFAKTISVFFTPPGDTEKIVFSVSVGPNDDPLSDFCGFWPGYWIAGAIPSDDVGMYNARWSVEFDQSTQPDAPLSRIRAVSPCLSTAKL
ncbi:hypothetical protein C8J57DRAFT_1515020 [Mycena rebaudengoi]|nr:hypothetical protein C8J57DRAFT_1515020 [Mycena rebaudengoi]